ncbi:MAG: hypothetical protein JEY94_05540 [Melioribacteraceae bacterium]|nr:hypothetical protein [Melioribacteraceae bacterium]
MAKAENILHLPIVISNYLLIISLVVIFTVLVLYLAKLIKYHEEVKKEFDHPIKLNFSRLLPNYF